MKINDVAGKVVHINASTIVLKNENGKTAGMITGVQTFYNMSTRDKFQFISLRAEMACESWKGIDWKHMFLINKKWYYLFSSYRLANAEVFRAVDGDKPIEKIKLDREKAERFGAEIIVVNKIIDTRYID